MTKTAQRMRAYRSRREAGRIVLELEIDEVELVTKLERMGLLPEGCDHARAEIKCAAQRMLAYVINEEKYT